MLLPVSVLIVVLFSPLYTQQSTACLKNCPKRKFKQRECMFALDKEDFPVTEEHDCTICIHQYNHAVLNGCMVT